MADPVSIGVMTAISMASTVAGSALSAGGAMNQGQAQANMYTFQAGQAEQNRRIALQNAEYERVVGGEEAMTAGIKSRQTMGKIVNNRGASGLRLNEGSNADIVESQGAIASHDQDVIRANAGRRAYGYEVEAYTQAGNAKMYKAAAANSKTAGKINAATSILGGISSVSSQWAKGSAAGMFGSGSKPNPYYGPLDYNG